MNIEHLYSLYRQYPAIQTDTRKPCADTLFFALSGPNFNGNAFAKDALSKGAAYAIVDDEAYALDDRYVVMPDTLAALQELARFHRQQLHIPVLAITGSNGKTTTKELVHAVLKTKYKVTATEGNLNNHIGVPLTVLKIPVDAEMAIIEMGANHQKEIAAYCSIALPSHGLITNVGKAHIEGFGGEEGVKKGKGELYDWLRASQGTIFLNADLPYLAEMATGVDKRISYGTTEGATYTGHADKGGIYLTVVSPEIGTINTQLVGTYNFPNVMAAIAVGRHFNVPAETIREAIESYAPDNSRSQLINVAGNSVIMDAYNANPSSMKEAINNLAALNAQKPMLWLGGMKEMGLMERQEHLAVVAAIQRWNIWNSVLLVGKEFEGVSERYQWFIDSAAAAEYVRHHKPEGATILIKGSRGSKMELLLDALKTTR